MTLTINLFSSQNYPALGISLQLKGDRQVNNVSYYKRIPGRNNWLQGKDPPSPSIFHMIIVAVF